MREEISDFNVFPHRVFASVVLVNNKIVNWKTGNRRWTKDNYGSSNQPRIVLTHKIKIRSRSFLVKNSAEHHKAFTQKAPKFYKKFKLYPGFKKSNMFLPY